MKVKKIVVNPVLNGKDPIEVDVTFEISFQGREIRHTHKANFSETTIYDVDFTLDGYNDIEGKLWALDRLTENSYFSLSPMFLPKEDKEVLNVSINLYGPFISWFFSLS